MILVAAIAETAVTAVAVLFEVEAAPCMVALAAAAPDLAKELGRHSIPVDLPVVVWVMMLHCQPDQRYEF